MESTEVQADPVSHKIHLLRAMLTSPSVSPPVPSLCLQPSPFFPSVSVAAAAGRPPNSVLTHCKQHIAVCICCCMQPHGTVYSRLMSLDPFSSLCLLENTAQEFLCFCCIQINTQPVACFSYHFGFVYRLGRCAFCPHYSKYKNKVKTECSQYSITVFILRCS